MTREEIIKEVAGTYAKDACNPASKRGLLYDGFVDGAEWALDFALQEAKSVVIEHFGIEDKYADEVEDLFNQLEERLGK